MTVNLFQFPNHPSVQEFIRVACEARSVADLQERFQKMDTFKNYWDKFRFIDAGYCIFVVFIDFDRLISVCSLPTDKFDEL